MDKISYHQCAYYLLINFFLYFFSDLSQDSCDSIVLTFLGKNSIKDVQVIKELHPIKKNFKLSLLRSHDKQTYIRAISRALIDRGYIDLKDGANKKNLTKEDIIVLKSF